MYVHSASFLIAIQLGALVGALSPSPGHHRRGIVPRISSKTYALEDWYEGWSFFSEWSFFTGPDPTNGNVNYLDMQDALDQGLAYVNSDNATVLGVDSWSYAPVGGYRNSTRITSNKSYSSGLFIFDAAAMPVGCGVWPSFWTCGPNWPSAGEIDIVEGINDQANNQMTLHSGTSNACTLDGSGTGTFTGRVLNKNCYSTETSDSGCSILDTDSRSFGKGFNRAGGGVFAFLWDTTEGMAMWFFVRGEIPSDIADGAPTPSRWGEPAGLWSSATCDISANFYDHSIVIDTTVCGGWAGGAYSKSACPGTCAEMVANATNFDDAKWVVNYVAVYQ